VRRVETDLFVDLTDCKYKQTKKHYRKRLNQPSAVNLAVKSKVLRSGVSVSSTSLCVITVGVAQSRTPTARMIQAVVKELRRRSPHLCLELHFGLLFFTARVRPSSRAALG
jgi:hypothetical protein